MAISALANYQENQAVAAALEKAVTCLSGLQTSNGGFASWGTENSNSASMVIVALSALGIDTDSPIDALLSYKTPDNRLGYSNTKYNDMASEQGFRALVAYTKMKAAGEAYNIYRFEDMGGNNTIPVITIKAGEEQELGAGFPLPESGVYTIKGFVWDNLEDMNALMEEPVIVEVAEK